MKKTFCLALLCVRGGSGAVRVGIVDFPVNFGGVNFTLGRDFPNLASIRVVFFNERKRVKPLL